MNYFSKWIYFLTIFEKNSISVSLTVALITFRSASKDFTMMITLGRDMLPTDSFGSYGFGTYGAKIQRNC